MRSCDALRRSRARYDRDRDSGPADAVFSRRCAGDTLGAGAVVQHRMGDSGEPLAASPIKYFVMGLTIGLGFALAGWRGAVIAVGVITLEQYGAEATKAIFSRPRPSPQLVSVVGSPTGFSFPSTTMTFFSATFGVLAILAARAKSSACAGRCSSARSCVIAAGCARSRRARRALAERRHPHGGDLARLDLGRLEGHSVS